MAQNLNCRTFSSFDINYKNYFLETKQHLENIVNHYFKLEFFYKYLFIKKLIILEKKESHDSWTGQQVGRKFKRIRYH